MQKFGEYILVGATSYFLGGPIFTLFVILAGAKVWEVRKFGRCESLGGTKVWEVLKFGRC